MSLIVVALSAADAQSCGRPAVRGSHEVRALTRHRPQGGSDDNDSAACDIPVLAGPNEPDQQRLGGTRARELLRVVV